MGEESVTGPGEPEFDRKRRAARARLDSLVGAQGEDEPARNDWFLKVYETAGDDPASVPWADLAPHPLLSEWLAGDRQPIPGQRALDIGCGLGDNAEALAAHDWTVTAFDLSPIAVAWSKRRFPETSVDYCQADLFNAPSVWSTGFDLVHECYTLQALPDGMRERAIPAIADFIAPGGRLVVIARAAVQGADRAGPPWPLSRTDIEAFTRHGLVIDTWLTRQREGMNPHYVVDFRKE